MMSMSVTSSIRDGPYSAVGGRNPVVYTDRYQSMAGHGGFPCFDFSSSGDRIFMLLSVF